MASVDSVVNSPVIHGEIEFRNLTFSYGDTPVLRDVSARIEAGQTVAIVGPTGSGKSTLISLLARMHDPPPGTVFVDGNRVLGANPPASDTVDQLSRLADLHDRGALTDAEFSTMKAKILGSE